MAATVTICISQITLHDDNKQPSRQKKSWDDYYILQRQYWHTPVIESWFDTVTDQNALITV